ncbi:hypothetical protein JCM9803A_33420 [Rhodococcus erythropolis]
MVEEQVLPLGGRSLHPMTLGGRSLHPMTLGGRSLHPMALGGRSLHPMALGGRRALCPPIGGQRCRPALGPVGGQTRRDFGAIVVSSQKHTVTETDKSRRT